MSSVFQAIPMSYAYAKGGGVIDINIYPLLTDVKNDNFLTVNAAQKFNDRLSYFGFINFGKKQSANSSNTDIIYYTEQNLRWKISDNSPLDLTIQINFRSGADNDRYRLGVRWRLSDTEGISGIFRKLNLSYAINLHGVQFDKEDSYVWQLEHSFRMTFPYISDRLYLAGFMDHTFNQTLPQNFPSSPIVGEAQLGFKIFDNFYAIAEYRINDFRRTEVDNLAVGIEYKSVW